MRRVFNSFIYSLVFALTLFMLHTRKYIGTNYHLSDNLICIEISRKHHMEHQIELENWIGPEAIRFSFKSEIKAGAE